jgi:hypothetical protein
LPLLLLLCRCRASCLYAAVAQAPRHPLLLFSHRLLHPHRYMILLLLLHAALLPPKQQPRQAPHPGHWLLHQQIRRHIHHCQLLLLHLNLQG